MLKQTVEYFPKGSMCATCKHLPEDCSQLEFHEMQVISSCKVGSAAEYRFVKCEAYERYVENE